MGWDGIIGKSKKELVATLKGRAVKSKLVGNCLWCVAESFGEPYIGLYLIRKEGKTYYYKALTEWEGPLYYSCPLSFLAEVPFPEKSPYAKKWREKVKAWHLGKELKKLAKEI
jgi:hypothetical protein